MKPDHYGTRLPHLDISGKLILYRVARTRYADLSGMGAYKTGGRWNEKGQRAVYTSVEIGTAVLEVLSHLDRDMPPLDHYSMMTISVDAGSCVSWTADSLIRQMTPQPTRLVFEEDKPGAFLLTYESLERADIWGEKVTKYLNYCGMQRRLGLIAPSIFTPAYNVVLYPDSPAFDSVVKLESVQPFSFHPYLFGARPAAQ